MARGRIIPGVAPVFDRWKGPPADATCRPTRVVERGGVKLTVWTCTDPVESWDRSWFRPERVIPAAVDRYFPGAVAAYWDGPGFGGLVRYSVFDGGPEEGRRTSARPYDDRVWLAYLRVNRFRISDEARREVELDAWWAEVAAWTRALRARGGQPDGEAGASSPTAPPEPAGPPRGRGSRRTRRGGRGRGRR